LQWALWKGQPDIARLIMNRGADMAHVNAYGWSMLFFCWAALAEPSFFEDAVQLLGVHALSGLTVRDADGWTCLHRIAAYGTAEEAGLLLAKGANPLAPSSEPVRWNALQQAVFYNNHATFSVIKEHVISKRKMPDYVDLVDERGWTLLHLAATTGNRCIIVDLRADGADPSAVMNKAYEYVPPGLVLKECIAADSAANAGLEKLKTLEEALEAHREADVFFDAKEEY
jgi:ankyrin repeat protein